VAADEAVVVLEEVLVRVDALVSGILLHSSNGTILASLHVRSASRMPLSWIDRVITSLIFPARPGGVVVQQLHDTTRKMAIRSAPNLIARSP
jgi:hypothetical protein